MTEKLYYLCSAIGILLTFIASMAALIVSIISINSSKQTAKHTNYQNIISTGRAKWQSDLRDCASKYFTQIARLCGNQEKDVTNIFNKRTKCARYGIMNPDNSGGQYYGKKCIIYRAYKS